LTRCNAARTHLCDTYSPPPSLITLNQPSETPESRFLPSPILFLAAFILSSIGNAAIARHDARREGNRLLVSSLSRSSFWWPSLIDKSTIHASRPSVFFPKTEVSIPSLRSATPYLLTRVPASRGYSPIGAPLNSNIEFVCFLFQMRTTGHTCSYTQSELRKFP